jgi:hypothetical protein
MKLMSHLDEIIAVTAGAGTSLSLAAVNPPQASGGWAEVLPYAATVLSTTMVVVVNRLFAVREARKRARADFLDKEAKAMREDTDPSNDKEARDKALEAAELRAEADALGRKE